MKYRLVWAMLIGSSVAAIGGAASAAVIAPSVMTKVSSGETLVQPIATKKVVTTRTHRNGKVVTKRKVTYSRDRYGPRYRAKRAGYGHYHQGYWYRTPWWGAGVPGGPTIVIRP
ncbi:hypothetical protein FHS85_004897 [Rhodoligotrophos appendicifer]